MEQLYQIFLQYPKISTDTRAITPNSIFVCLKGANFDGNQFALKALSLGCRYVITENQELDGHPDCIVVENALKTLQQLALYHRQQLHIPVIGVTGTNGKTTTKELIHAVLSSKYKTVCTKGNLNNHIGVPLTLLSITNEDEIAIVEMGANHLGEIAQLCALALPNYGVVTNIGHAHLEGFGSFENIKTTKFTLYDAVVKVNGIIFINADDPVLMDYPLQENARYYAQDECKEVHGKVEMMNPQLKITLCGESLTTQMTGHYNLYNILAATAIGICFGVEKQLIRQAIANYLPDNQRSQVIKKGTATFIADYYNANPDSMRQALCNLAQIDFPHKKAILGDMFELGNESRQAHQDIVKLTEELKIETCFAGQEFTKVASEKGRFFETLEALNNVLDMNDYENCITLVKGSRGVHLEKLKIFTKQ